jgi:hypothetical protein
MDKKLKCDCGGSLFIQPIKIKIVDLSDAVNGAIDFRQRINGIGDRAQYPEELLKEITASNTGYLHFNMGDCPSLLVLAYHSEDFLPQAFATVVNTHIKECDKECKRRFQKVDIVLHSNISWVEKEIGAFIMETYGETPLEGCPLVECAKCQKKYIFSPGVGLEEYKE